MPQMVAAMHLPPNETIGLAQDSLAEILVEKDHERGYFVIRHPAIAEFVVDDVAPREVLAEAFVAFLKTISFSLPPPGPDRRWSRAFRVYRNTINHKKLGALFPGRVDLVRDIYERIKGFYADEGHYWLQYGSYELVCEDALDAAENYINQSAALMPNSIQVATATGHLLLKKSLVAQTLAAAEALMLDGVRILRAQMADTRQIQVHPYHIFGTQMMSYVTTWIADGDQAEKYREIHDELRRSIPVYLRGNLELQRLLDDIKRAELSTALRRN